MRAFMSFLHEGGASAMAPNLGNSSELGIEDEI